MRRSPSALVTLRTVAPMVLAALVLLPIGQASAAVSFPQIAKLTGLDTAAGDSFGYSVAISGDTALIGGPFDDDLGAASGAAYIFERDAGGPDQWGQVAKLLAPDGASADWFGVRVALDGDTAVVTATVNDFSRKGYAYVFGRNAGAPNAWGVVARLTADDGDELDGCGNSVDVEGDRVAIGSNFSILPGSLGAVYLYERDVGGPEAWGQTAKLTSAAACHDNVTYCGWGGEDFFGATVSISGESLAVGASGSAGAAYVFHRNKDGSWRRIARPQPEESRPQDYGTAVVMDGRAFLASVPGDDDLGAQAGAAFVFELDASLRPPWREVGKLHANEGEAGDRLGTVAAIDNGTLVIGAPQRESGRDWQGEAFVFRQSGSDWNEVANLQATDAEPFDVFGWSVGVSGDTILVGAYGESSAGSDAGAAYVFRAKGGVTSTAQANSAFNTHSVADRGEAALTLDPLPSEATTVALTGRLSLGGGDVAPGDVYCLRPHPEFALYYDTFQLTFSGNRVSGVWHNLPGFPTDDFMTPVTGTVADDQVILRCDAQRANCPLGLSWEWIIDLPPDGTMIMLQHDGSHWNSWIDQLAYDLTPGRCQ